MTQTTLGDHNNADELQAALERRNEHSYNDTATLRYMASDYPEVVFYNTAGYMRLATGDDAVGDVTSVRIGPYQPPNEDYLVEVTRLRDVDDASSKPATFCESEVFESKADAWEFVREVVDLSEYEHQGIRR